MIEPAISAPDWLTRRPIAHRGLHDRAAGRVENTLGAARAAIAADCAIECDVQFSADAEAMVFHDFELDRLTASAGLVEAKTAAALARIPVGGISDTIPRLSDLLGLIDGRVPLICEIKSAFDGDMRLADRVASLAQGYRGPLALKSFDPAVLIHLRQVALPPRIPLGIVAEATYDDAEWDFLKPDRKRDLAALSHLADSRPAFLSYAVTDLPHAAATLFRQGLGRPVVTWTVRTPADRATAGRWADQMVFEGFTP